MITAIYFDNQLFLKTSEISNKFVNSMLTQKLHAQCTTSQTLPKLIFSLCRILR